ncbi:MAG: flagellar protein FlaG [Paenibacillaceae bacterium]|jgi:flagellar protein FlaG|nr:flagellar protein FlaG [Paenibacillaceae bacterium]
MDAVSFPPRTVSTDPLPHKPNEHDGVKTRVQEDAKKEIKELSETQFTKSIEKAIKAMKSSHTYLEVSVHDATKQLSIRVHDQETGEIIREIPPEKTLDFVAKLWEMAGIFIDKRR